jgi:hypothetical protein
MPQKEMHPSSDPQTADNPQPTVDNPQPRRQPGTRGIRRPDGRRNPEKLRENQQSLGVGPDHRTPDMKKGHRGTFP